MLFICSPVGSFVSGRKFRALIPHAAECAVLALLLVVAGLIGCSSGFPKSESSTAPEPPPTSTSVSVSPSSVIVAAGSSTFFIAVFVPSFPSGGSLTWAVNVPLGGTITGEGIYTASATAGNYIVTATWTPSTPSAGVKISGSASVQVLPVPQQSVVLNPVMTQASGAIQSSGALQNAGVARQEVPLVLSMDVSGKVQVQSGFVIPVVCVGSASQCP